MRKEGCPQKVDKLDGYFNAFYYCRMKLVDIAAIFNVTKFAVEKGLKRFDIEAYNFERELRKSQNKIKRKENDRVRKQKEREKKPLYHLVVKRILKDPEVLHILRQVSGRLNNDEQVMCCRYIPCLERIFHPIPQVASVNLGTITPSKTTKIVDYEIRAMRSILIGVPGPDILEIPEYLNNRDKQSALKYAESALKTAGYITSDASVADVQDGRIKIISPTKLKNLKNIHINESIAMVNAPDQPALCDMSRKEKIRITKSWLAQNKAAEKAAAWNTSGGTGKKGKGGGTININDRQAFSAKNGQ
ncbi:MAG: hypothetical protein AB1538_10600 [Bacillota bacterium]